MKKKTPARTSNAPAILIVGDWVVDEYWFLVRHHSDTSSHTGFLHYRIFASPHEIVADLCGAGHVARVLHHLRGESTSPRLVGLGAWNGTDTERIAHLIHSRDSHASCPLAHATYQLVAKPCDHPPAVELHTLSPDAPTIRVVRLYHDEGNDLEQWGRVDWEPAPQPPPAPPVAREKKPAKPSLPPEALENVTALIVNDLDKGVVTDDLIEALSSACPQADWYVRTKKDRPKWLAKVAGRLRLHLIGPERAAQLSPWPSWLVRGQPTKEAIEVLSDGATGAENLVLLTDNHEVIARTSPGMACITACSRSLPTVLSQLGWPTAVFARLAWQLIVSGDGGLDPSVLRTVLEDAETLAGVPVPVGMRLEERPRKAFEHSESWAEQTTAWSAAHKDLGIVQTSKGPTLQLWRSYTQLPGYVACITEKRMIIEDLARHLRAFSRSSERAQSLKILLQADPGSGKTFLAKCLANAFDLAFHAFDVSQMLHREELLDLFEEVATAQATRRRRILVFVDEINTVLDAQQVYSAFLAPLEEGVYTRRGRRYRLHPCAWVFAGTGLSLKEPGHHNKLEDFHSRMNLTARIDFQSLKETSKRGDEAVNAEARLEQVYLGASLIAREYPDVFSIHPRILEFLASSDPSHRTPRDLRRLAQSLENVQYGRVGIQNCRRWKPGGKWQPGPGEESYVTIEP